MVWQSGLVVLRDDTNGTDILGSGLDKFLDPNGALPDSEDLAQGETGLLYSGSIFYNPSGHHLSITVTVCSENGLAGTCINKATTLTP